MRARIVMAIAMWCGLAATGFAIPSSQSALHNSDSVRMSGIVVPLADEPLTQLIDARARVAFDFTGGGEQRPQSWLTADAAWLVWDPDWRGQVRSGLDMIGPRAWSTAWRNGFAALSALDENGDGQLTGAELDGLALWHDENRNGQSDAGEVVPVNVHGITAIAVRGTRTRPGVITAPTGVRFEDGRTRPLYDWTPALAASAS